MRVKGVLFPSFKDAMNPSGRSGQGSRALPKGREWRYHQGRLGRIKNLKRLCAPILSSTDEATLAAIEVARAATSTEPEPEYGKLFLVNRARELGEDNGVPFPEMMGLLMATFQKIIEEKPEDQRGSTEIDPDNGGSQTLNNPAV